MLTAISILSAVIAAALLAGVARHRFKARVRRLQREQQQLDERLNSVINPKDHL